MPVASGVAAPPALAHFVTWSAHCVTGSVFVKPPNLTLFARSDRAPDAGADTDIGDQTHATSFPFPASLIREIPVAASAGEDWERGGRWSCRFFLREQTPSTRFVRMGCHSSKPLGHCVVWRRTLAGSGGNEQLLVHYLRGPGIELSGQEKRMERVDEENCTNVRCAFSAMVA